MDIVLGFIFWGGLLLLVLLWIGGMGLTGRHTGRGAGSHAGSPSSTVPPAATTQDRAGGTEDAGLREDDALIDGLVIGHYLTRDHYTERIAGLEEQIEELSAERERLHEAAAAGDDLLDGLDYAEFDAIGGFGVEPWAEDLFDQDDEQ